MNKIVLKMSSVGVGCSQMTDYIEEFFSKLSTSYKNIEMSWSDNQCTLTVRNSIIRVYTVDTLVL